MLFNRIFAIAALRLFPPIAVADSGPLRGACRNDMQACADLSSRAGVAFRLYE